MSYLPGYRDLELEYSSVIHELKRTNPDLSEIDVLKEYLSDSQAAVEFTKKLIDIHEELFKIRSEGFSPSLSKEEIYSEKAEHELKVLKLKRQLYTYERRVLFFSSKLMIIQSKEAESKQTPYWIFKSSHGQELFEYLIENISRKEKAKVSLLYHYFKREELFSTGMTQGHYIDFVGKMGLKQPSKIFPKNHKDLDYIRENLPRLKDDFLRQKRNETN